VRFIGLDIHRDFCEIAISDGGKARSAGRVNTSLEALTVLGNSLTPEDKVILESTGNALEGLAFLGARGDSSPVESANTIPFAMTTGAGETISRESQTVCSAGCPFSSASLSAMLLPSKGAVFGGVKLAQRLGGQAIGA